MRIVVALGGNAQLQRGERHHAVIQLQHVRATADVVAPLAADHELIICHGNGPQVGMLALESQADPVLTHPYPLDDLVAQTQGMIGYWLAQSLRNAGVTRPFISLITQTIVDSGDPAFARPAKSVGPGYAPAGRRDNDHRAPPHRRRPWARHHRVHAAPMVTGQDLRLCSLPRPRETLQKERSLSAADVVDHEHATTQIRRRT